MKLLCGAVTILLMGTMAGVNGAEPAKDLQSGVDSLVTQLGESMEKQSLTTVAILDLVNLDLSVSNAGRYIAERSCTALHRTGKFTVVERDLLERTLKRLNLTIADLADPANVQLLAKALNIQALVKGSLSDLDDKIEINMRLVRAVNNAGEVIAVAQTVVPKDAQTAKLMGQAVAAPSVAGGGGSGAPATGATGPAVNLELGQGVKLEMVLIPASEEQGIAKPFYIGKYEVTQAQWKLVMENASASEKGNYPVANITWDECQVFIGRLNRLLKDKLSASGKFRLPTEAQWEYACRAGTKTAYYSGDDVSDLDAVGWYETNSGGASHPVGKKEPNAYGIYDMHGNVWEWCDECVLRGGSWSDYPRYCRSASRSGNAPTYRGSSLGFRVVGAR